MHIPYSFRYTQFYDINIKMSEGTFCRVEAHVYYTLETFLFQIKEIKKIEQKSKLCQEGHFLMMWLVLCTLSHIGSAVILLISW